MHNGLRVVADGYCGSWMTELIERCHGHHEPQEERAFYEVITRLGHNATMMELVAIGHATACGSSKGILVAVL